MGYSMTEEKQDWSYTIPDDGKVFPEHLIGAVWSYVKWFRLDPHPHSEEQLANLVYPAFQASLCSEEGRPVRLRVVFDIAPKRFTVRFAEPLPYTAGQLVKLAPTIGVASRWLVAQPDETSQNSVQIAGILDPDILPVDRVHQRWGHGLTTSQNFPLPTRPPWLNISVLGPGWVRVSTLSTSFELRNCCMREPLIVGRIQYVIDWCREIPSRLGIQDTGITNLGAALARSFLVNVLANISDARHGGCLLVLPNNADLSSLPLKTKYRMDSDMVQVAIRERASVSPKISLQGTEFGKDQAIEPSQIARDDVTLAKSLLLDRDLAQLTDCVAALAAVDGAVILQRDLRLVGFGAEITIPGMPSGDEKVEYGNHPPLLGKPAPASLADFGMRHRSAIRFCQEIPGTMAFVVSQDGGIRLFHSVDGSVRQWVELSAEEW
jgi:hypothetical protein